MNLKRKKLKSQTQKSRQKPFLQAELKISAQKSLAQDSQKKVTRAFRVQEEPAFNRKNLSQNTSLKSI